MRASALVDLDGEIEGYKLAKKLLEVREKLVENVEYDYLEQWVMI